MAKNVLLEKDVISEEIAVKELQKLIMTFNFEKVESYKIKEDYPQALTAIKKGLLIFDKTGKPVYNLAFPITKEVKENSVEKAVFKTRIRPFELQEISKGINMSKDQQKYILNCLSFLSQLSTGELNSIEKFDYKVVEQISTIFF